MLLTVLPRIKTFIFMVDSWYLAQSGAMIMTVNDKLRLRLRLGKFSVADFGKLSLHGHQDRNPR